MCAAVFLRDDFDCFPHCDLLAGVSPTTHRDTPLLLLFESQLTPTGSIGRKKYIDGRKKTSECQPLRETKICNKQ